MGVIRISDENYFWLMNIRGAGSVDDVLSLLRDHLNECDPLKHRVRTELTAEYLKAKKEGRASIISK